MNEKQLTFYLPLDADVELKITVETRFYNGIHSDPRTITREPSIGEVRTLQAHMRREDPGFKWNTTLP